MATSRSLPLSVNAVNPDVVIVVWITEGDVGRITSQTTAPAINAAMPTAAAIAIARYRDHRCGSGAAVAALAAVMFAS